MIEFVDKPDKRLIREMLGRIEKNPYREGLLDTPARVVQSWRKLYGGYAENPKDVLKTVFSEGACDEMVILRDCEFYSTCEHHLLPFFGKAHIGYLPSGRVVGVSKLARLLEVYARRLQIQENLTTQIADSIQETLEAKGVMVVLEAQHFCYHEDTEILTTRGWVRFPDLADEHEVAAVDPYTGSMHFETPSNRMRYEYNGPLITFETSTISLAVTPEHTMYYRVPWDRKTGKDRVHRQMAGFVHQHIQIDQVARSWNGVPVTTRVKLGKRKVFLRDYAAFMGIFLSEGCVRDARYRGKRQRDVVISQKKVHTLHQIKCLLTAMKLPFRVNDGGNGVKQVILLAEFCDDLKVFGKSGDKFVPDLLKNACPEAIEIFLDWFARGDGSILRREGKQDRIQYVSKSYRLIDDLQEMLVRVGRTGAVQHYKDHARIEVRNRQWSGIKKPERIAYTGWVHCVTVSTGAIMVRYKGKTAVCGNCMTARGVEKQHSIMVTSAVRGAFENPETRNEFLRLIGK